MKSFQRALVTGASSGLGRAICVELARQGTSIVACARRGDLLRELVLDLAARGVQAAAVTLDVTRPEEVRAAIEAASREGPLDLVVAAAGVAEHSLEAVDRGARTRRALEHHLRLPLEAGQIARRPPREHVRVCAFGRERRLQSLEA